jgi:hypothetical protein
MLEVNQKVLVIPEKGDPFNGTIIATAKGDDGPPAYKVTANDLGADQLGKWHKACDVFVLDQTWQEKKDSWDKFLKE